MPNNSAISIIDDGSSVCEGTINRLASAGHTAEKLWRVHALVQVRCLFLCFSFGGGI
jgi:hypothetical protein